MPRRRKQKRGYRKKYRRHRMEKPSVSLISPVPTVFKTTLQYVETVTLNSGASGAANTVSYKANSLYDPYQSGVGHQPLGFDQIMTLYEHFYVVGSLITCKFLTQGDTAAVGTSICGIELSGSVTPTTTAETWIEQPRITYGVLTANDHLTLRKGFSAYSFFRQGRVEDNATLRGNASADCSELAYYHIGNASPGGSLDPSPVQVIVKISYSCLFTEPKALPQS